MQKGRLRILEGGLLAFWCAGCGEAHALTSAWQFNGNYERPTFTPSVLVTCGHFAPGHTSDCLCWCTYNREHADNPAPFKCVRCHTYVTDGKINFLADCSHGYAGKTVELEAF